MTSPTETRRGGAGNPRGEARYPVSRGPVKPGSRDPYDADDR